jgi:hypothetical protein
MAMLLVSRSAQLDRGIALDAMLDARSWARVAALWFAIVLELVWLAAARPGVRARSRDDLRA